MKNKIISLLVSLIIHGVVLTPLLMYERPLYSDSQSTESGNKINNGYADCNECEYDPSEHDEPHEKLIDTFFCKIKKVVKAGFGLFILIKGVANIISSIFKK